MGKIKRRSPKGVAANCTQCNDEYISKNVRSMYCAPCKKAKEAQHHLEWKRKNRERSRALNRESQKRCLPQRAAAQMAREALKLQAVPAWADMEEIKYIYNLAKERGLEVDHIVPLRSKFVCGLHTPDNLRCIPKELNQMKSNRYWPDMAIGG